MFGANAVEGFVYKVAIMVLHMLCLEMLYLNAYSLCMFICTQFIDLCGF